GAKRPRHSTPEAPQPASSPAKSAPTTARPAVPQPWHLHSNRKCGYWRYPALADRLHLSEVYRLGLVLPVDRRRRFSRYIIAWKLCPTMTLNLALNASGLGLQRPGFLSHLHSL